VARGFHSRLTDLKVAPAVRPKTGELSVTREMIGILQFISQKSVTIPSGTALCKFATAGRFCLNEWGFMRRTLRRDDRGRVGAAKSRSLVET
jgi:hypothetical protein